MRMRCIASRSCAILALLTLTSCAEKTGVPDLDILMTGGLVFDGSGSEPVTVDVGVRDGIIAFVGNAQSAGVQARDVLDLDGKWLTPGFIDMHSHAELNLDYGRDAAPYLRQGITTVVLGVDGDGEANISEQLTAWELNGIGVNGLLYVGHGAIRSAVMGTENRSPPSDEMNTMKTLIRDAMREGAFGLSSGLFYVPGTYAETDELVDLMRAASAADANAIYDTHDRDLGAVYNGVGYEASVREGIRIGEESNTRVIFSHFNLQGTHNYGRADVGAELINSARSRGVDVWAAQHPYTATRSSLRAYTIPTWAAAGGHESMVARFDDKETSERIKLSGAEMLAIRGGAEKILLVDERPELNGKTLAEYAGEIELPVLDAIQEILRVSNAKVMNLDLYDYENTRRLAEEPWMMTCTDGRTPRPDQAMSHPRTFGAFPMKFRLFVQEEGNIKTEFAIRSFTGLAADFLRLPDRGYVRTGYVADLLVLDPKLYQDKASYQSPQLVAEGANHVLIGGRFAIRDGELTGELVGQAIRRPKNASVSPESGE